MKFDYKLYKTQNERLLAISDSSIVGKNPKEDDIEINISKEFYSENKCSERKVLALIKSATIVNAIGKSIVSLMIKEKLVDEDKVLYVQGIPHVQIIVMK